MIIIIVNGIIIYAQNSKPETLPETTLLGRLCLYSVAELIPGTKRRPHEIQTYNDDQPDIDNDRLWIDR